MSKLLILTDWFAPGYKAGGPIRSTLNLATLLQQDYQVRILTTDRDYGDEQAYPEIDVDEWITFQDSQIQVYYLSTEKPRRRIIQTIIKELRPDLVYMNSLFSLHFTLIPLVFRVSSAKYILAPRGMLQAGALSIKSRKKMLFLKVANLFSLYKNVHFHATDDQEQLDIKQHISPLPKCIEVISNIPTIHQKSVQAEKYINRVKLVFCSRISPKKNLDFLLRLLVNLENEAIKIELTIIGPIEDELYWTNCQGLINQAPPNVLINYEGPLPFSKLEEQMIKHHFFILPTHGENFGHAIFEAFSAGLPVIISDQTPWRNLKDQKIGWDISLDQPEAFVNAIETAAAMDQETYDLWSKSAWEYARLYVEGSDLLERYQELFRVD